MKLWGKDKTHSRREIFRARGREEILHTWEREKAFQKRKRSDCIARAHKSRREFAALFSWEIRTVRIVQQVLQKVQAVQQR